MTEYRMLIDGALVHGSRTIPVVDPSTGESFTKSPVADEAQLDQAVEAAARAFPQWAAMPWAKRSECLLEFARRLEAEAGHFAALLVREQGKPLGEASYEVDATLRGLRFYAGVELKSETRAHPAGAYQVDRRPLGVVAGVTPWNFPMILASNKYAPALITGNTVVLKPAPTTPLTTLELGRLAVDVFPKGVLNIVADDNDLGARLTSHPSVAKISFTGSTATGKAVMRSAVDDMKRVTLELGGNDPAIVLEDADLEAAARGLAATVFLNAGQVCAAPKRLYVAAKVYDEFVEKFVTATRDIRMGAGNEEGVSLGPVQNRAQFEKVRSLIEEAAAGGTVLVGGHVANRPGYFIEPTVIADLPDDAPLVAGEQFGPVVPILRFDSETEAVTRANRGPYGLGASIWTRDLERARTLGRDITAGSVWINQHTAIHPEIPFGGVKQSGLGSEGGYEGVHEYTRIQVINAAG